MTSLAEMSGRDSKLILEQQQRIQELETARDDLVAALIGVADLYTQLVHSGDAGFWDPEEEEPIIAARKAIAKAGAK